MDPNDPQTGTSTPSNPPPENTPPTTPPPVVPPIPPEPPKENTNATSEGSGLQAGSLQSDGTASAETKDVVLAPSDLSLTDYNNREGFTEESSKVRASKIVDIGPEEGGREVQMKLSSGDFVIVPTKWQHDYDLKPGGYYVVNHKGEASFVDGAEFDRTHTAA